MNTKDLVQGDKYESTVLREAAEKLNFIWRLAYAYKPPELLQFLADLTGELDARREFVRTSLATMRGKHG
jgi:hypothetical protein